MSYDLAVWAGERPQSEAEAAERYAQMMDRLETGDGELAPISDRIRAYVAALLAKWPDITEDDGADSPWADGPMINNAFGECIYFSMVWSRAEEASEFAARVAAQHGLVCYDPQAENAAPAS
jgi:hypothetical protein